MLFRSITDQNSQPVNPEIRTTTTTLSTKKGKKPNTKNREPNETTMQANSLLQSINPLPNQINTDNTMQNNQLTPTPITTTTSNLIQTLEINQQENLSNENETTMETNSQLQTINPLTEQCNSDITDQNSQPVNLEIRTATSTLSSNTGKRPFSR